jgi:zinc transport system substrate-binding protein
MINHTCVCMMKQFFLLLSLFFWMAFGTVHAKVLVSIPPLHALVCQLMEGVDTPELLLRGNESPHHFSLKPSHIRQLKQATAVIWIGPALEGFLTKPLLRHKTHQLSLLSLPLSFLAVRSAHTHECHDDDHDHSHEPEGGLDPHVWLDVAVMKEAIPHLTAFLCALDPIHQDHYKKNAQKALDRLSALLKKVQKAARKNPTLSFVAFHDAFQYFERMTGWKNQGALASAHSLEAHPKALQQIQALVASSQPLCFLEEPQSHSTLPQKLGKTYNRPVIRVDPLGSTLTPGPTLYEELLTTLTHSLMECHP